MLDIPSDKTVSVAAYWKLLEAELRVITLHIQLKLYSLLAFALLISIIPCQSVLSMRSVLHILSKRISFHEFTIKIS